MINRDLSQAQYKPHSQQVPAHTAGIHGDASCWMKRHLLAPMSPPFVKYALNDTVRPRGDGAFLPWGAPLGALIAVAMPPVPSERGRTSPAPITGGVAAAVGETNPWDSVDARFDNLSLHGRGKHKSC